MSQPFKNDTELLDHILKATKPLEGKNPADITDKHLAKLILEHDNPAISFVDINKWNDAQATFSAFEGHAQLTITIPGGLRPTVQGTNTANWIGISQGTFYAEEAGNVHYTASNHNNLVILFYNAQAQ